MPTRAIMIQGTGFRMWGKSMLGGRAVPRRDAGRGLSVARSSAEHVETTPPSPTRMAEEIGRRPGLQAIASTAPIVHYEPIFAEPETTAGSQCGSCRDTATAPLQARDFSKARAGLMAPGSEKFSVSSDKSADDYRRRGGQPGLKRTCRQNGPSLNMGFARRRQACLSCWPAIFNSWRRHRPVVGTQGGHGPGRLQRLITGFLVQTKFRRRFVQPVRRGYARLNRRTGL